jgi:hypothetical protein
MEQIRLWQAVLLSLDIDPRPDPDLGFTGEGAIGIFEIALGSIQARNRHRLRDRLAIAESSAEAGGLKVMATGRRFEGTLTLADFGRWATDKGLQLPKEFPKPLPRPDWSMWSQRLEATILDARALSCDIDPRRVRGKEPELREYFRRGPIVTDQVNRGNLKVFARPSGVNPAVNHVLLADFAKMADGLGWTMPEEFRKFIPPDQPLAVTSHAADEKPMQTMEHVVVTGAPLDKPGMAVGGPPTVGVTISLPHTTDELEALFKIIRASWTRYDEKHLPKQGAIAHEIDEALGLRPQSATKPSRFAEAFVKMIKPEKFRGRHKTKKP